MKYYQMSIKVSISGLSCVRLLVGLRLHLNLWWPRNVGLLFFIFLNVCLDLRNSLFYVVFDIFKLVGYIIIYIVCVV